MSLKLEIRRNADGVVVSDTWTGWSWHGAFWWQEGNARCDCNRELFFLQAQGIDTDDLDDDDTPCTEGRYSVRLSDAKTGAVLYDELVARQAGKGE